jgi:hypothetical protein
MAVGRTPVSLPAMAEAFGPREGKGEGGRRGASNALAEAKAAGWREGNRET